MNRLLCLIVVLAVALVAAPALATGFGNNNLALQHSMGVAFGTTTGNTLALNSGCLTSGCVTQNVVQSQFVYAQPQVVEFVSTPYVQQQVIVQRQQQVVNPYVQQQVVVQKQVVQRNIVQKQRLGGGRSRSSSVNIQRQRSR